MYRCVHTDICTYRQGTQERQRETEAEVQSYVFMDYRCPFLHPSVPTVPTATGGSGLSPEAQEELKLLMRELRRRPLRVLHHDSVMGPLI